MSRYRVAIVVMALAAVLAGCGHDEPAARQTPPASPAATSTAAPLPTAVPAATPSTDGIYIVGQDIQPGTYLVTAPQITRATGRG